MSDWYFPCEKNIKNSKKLLLKIAKMRQNRLQCIFGVISFHSGVYLKKYNLEMNIFRTAY